MDYTVRQLAALSGVSARTLRYYDEIGLLCPRRMPENEYRIYGPDLVDRLQQILFYRELGLPLEQIGKVLDATAYDRLEALEHQFTSLTERRQQIDALLNNVRRTIRTMKGEIIMTDPEKFEGFKKSLLAENEQRYGREIRQKYGDAAVDATAEKVAGMGPDQWQAQEQLSQEIAALLKQAVAAGDPGCAQAQEACDKHRQWLEMFWKADTYSKAAHRGMGELYASDPRFRAYYEAIAPGCAELLRDALQIYCTEA